MKVANVSIAEAKAVTEAAAKLQAAKAFAAKGDRERAIVQLEEVRVLLPSPTIEPTQRARLAAELGLARLKLEASDLVAARAHANEYRARVREWFPLDPRSDQQALELLQQIDVRDPCE